MVVAALLAKLLSADQWKAVLVDTGCMRGGEVAEVEATCHALNIPLVVWEASETFFAALAGVSDPEAKRKIIGRLFVECFDAAVAAHFGQQPAVFLAQGTIYPDRVESARARLQAAGGQHVIKSHHNVGGLPDQMRLRLLEPLQ